MTRPRARARIAVIAAVCAFVAAAEPCAQTAKAGAVGKSVLIYNGATAAQGGPEAIANVAQALGLAVRFFDRADKLPPLLKDTGICVIGGTEDDLEPFLAEFTPATRKALADWIRNGGRYLGICGGGYMASEGWEEKQGFTKALALIPMATEAWMEDPDPRIINVTWNGKRRSIYYQYGPAFLVEPGAGAEILARYDDGRAAALAMAAGTGRILVWGPHPEADETWLDDDPAPVGAENWRDTSDIARAMFARLLE